MDKELMDKELILYSTDEFYDFVLHYICSEELLSKNINEFRYISENNLRSYEYRARRYIKQEKDKLKVKVCALEDTNFIFDFDQIICKVIRL